MSPTLLGPAKKQRFFFNAVASLRVALRGRPRHPALMLWGVWQEGRRCAERGEGTQRRARAGGATKANPVALRKLPWELSAGR